MTVWGVDLGTRSVHIGSVFRGSVSFTAGKELSRHKQLQEIQTFLRRHVRPSDTVFIEEPPLAGRMNVRTALQMSITAGAIATAVWCPAYFVPVSSWKHELGMKGNATKEAVSAWLQAYSPSLFDKLTSQDQVDATCIAIYGEQVQHKAAELVQ